MKFLIILKLLIVFQFEIFYCFDCPDLPAGYIPVRGVKCYGIRILSVSERSYSSAFDICKNEITDGKLADLESEALYDFGLNSISVLLNYPDVPSTAKIDFHGQEYNVSGFFIDIRSYVLPNGSISYMWPSGRSIDDMNISGEESELVIGVLNADPEIVAFYGYSNPSDVGSVLCEFPAELECGPTPSGFIGFRTNSNCYFLSPLEEGERSYSSAVGICKTVPNTDIYHVGDSDDLFFTSFLTSVNDNAATFDKISTPKGDLPGFYFGELGPLPFRDYMGVAVGKLTAHLIINSSEPMTGVICKTKIGTAVQDPHIQHFLQNYGKSICYDLSGESEDIFILYKGRLSKVLIAGELRDDYYFGKILIQSPFFNYTIKESEEWIIGEIFKSSKMEINCVNRNEIIINIYKDKTSTFKVSRRKNAVDLYYINIEVMKINYATANGIFGDVHKKNYKFYESVQYGSIASISIEGKLFSAYKKEGERECWKISSIAAFYPKKIKDYVLN